MEGSCVLQLRDVRKAYRTGDFTQVALDDLSLSFRDNEFVAILGPSGSGKTTLLNIVGGLDHYDSGTLVIDDVDTRDYKARDWDTYRNNRIGFVFQSYNLIPHQSVVGNVELALTLAGVSRAERRRRALDALAEVGLREHAHKRPGQLSGGQMQRVAIARALINDPEILLADEPTGALDSTTSEQIMGLLTVIAADRLVIMVTHNPELAEQYATRTVHLRDGAIEGDSNPFDPALEQPPVHGRTRRTAMSFLTAIGLSFSNLMTKKGRTLMTSFAGSIGIIGIAAILALANGVNAYIKSVEQDTLAEYPLVIFSQSMDMTSFFTASQDLRHGSDEPVPPGKVREIQTLGKMFSGVGSNDLGSLKRFFDAGGGGIQDHVQSIQYSYNVTPQIFSSDTTDGVRQVNPDQTFASLGFGTASASSPLASAMSTDIFHELFDDASLLNNQFDVVTGRWPSNRDEVVVVLAPSGGLPDIVLYAMGLRDPAELDKMVQQVADNKTVTSPGPPEDITYDQIMGAQFKLITAADRYVKSDRFGVWTDKGDDKSFMQNLVDAGEDLHVTGIVRVKDASTPSALTPGIYYTPALTKHLIAQAADTDIVRYQLAHPDENVFTGRTFSDEKENPERSDFDLASLISIDENAIKQAFKFDQSKLRLDPSALNLSMGGLDASAINIDPATLPPLDLSGVVGSLDLSGALGSLDMGALVKNIDFQEILKSIDLTGLGEGVDFGVDREQAQALADRLVQGYLAWAVAEGVDAADVRTNFPVFMESDAAKEITADAQGMFDGVRAGLEQLGGNFTDQLVGGITAAVQKQIQAGVDAMQGQLAGAMGDVQNQIQQAIGSYMQQAMTAVSKQLTTQIGASLRTQIGKAMDQAMGQLAANMSDAMGIDQEAFKSAFKMNMSSDDLRELLVSMIATPQSSYTGNLTKLGYADLAEPYRIDIFPKDFDSKAKVISILDQYNADAKAAGNDDKVISFTDIVGTLMSSVTDIINVISYVLTAFVSISLIVSSIMIGVITYISVLERRKEIGILRSVGASKRDIRRVFNAETLIVGFIAGVLGIGATLLLTIPANAIVYGRWGIPNVAILPWQAGLILVAVSMGLTFLAGLIPASAASRKDPVEALRSE